MIMMFIQHQMLILIVCTYFISTQSRPEISVSVFNIQVFGSSKIEKYDGLVMRILVDIIRRYDVMFVQEIRDIDEAAIHVLMEAVNKDQVMKYDYYVSDRLGRTDSKEQYAYIYRSPVTLVHAKTYEDGEVGSSTDLFEREPYIALFKVKQSEFLIIGCHIKPTSADQEMNDLVKVWEAATSFYGTQDTILLGDFNAGCSYWPQKKRRKNKLRTQRKRFEWIFSDDMDTTLAKSSCPYDRMIITGNMQTRYIVNSNTVFHFDNEYQLTPEVAKAVSDHYPIAAAFTT